MQKKIAVAVGGFSPERDVSLSSGSLIANALMSQGYRVCLVDTYLGLPSLPEDLDSLFVSEGEFSYKIPSVAPDLERLRDESGNGSALIGKNVLTVFHAADLVFVALHGGIGENGTFQSVLDAEGISYTGSSAAGCLLAMDKSLTKELLLANGIHTARGIRLHLIPGVKEAILREIGVPCVVKPLSCGSSVGVSIVESEDQLDAALAAAAVYESDILVEEKLVGREFSVGVLRGSALPPIEIIPKSGFYDYKNKYQGGMTTEICPADLTPEETDAAMRASEAVHRVLRLGTYSRSDFILSVKDHNFYCLEANALPGMTPTSLLPQEAAAVGIPYPTLCAMIAEDAE